MEWPLTNVCMQVCYSHKSTDSADVGVNIQMLMSFEQLEDVRMSHACYMSPADRPPLSKISSSEFDVIIL